MSSGGIRLLLAGCGHMGGAMLHQWIAKQSFDYAYVVKPSPLPPDFESAKNIIHVSSLDAVPETFVPDVVLLAVRPPVLETVLPPYAKYADSLFLSVAAGKKLDKLASLLGAGSHSIIRAMPNIASEIGLGMTFAMGNQSVTPAQKANAEKLLHAIGGVAWIHNEDLFDAGTAVSGCGPAYVYVLIEAMAAAGEKLGLPADLALQLARQTIVGTGGYLAQSHVGVTALRNEIASPATMTEAAVKVLAAPGGLNDLMLKAMTAAVAQAKELAKLA